jgi:Family of unknown function (DUF5709)
MTGNYPYDGQLDPAESLEGDPRDDPLDAGYIPPDRWSPAERFGTTEAEEREGESLDQLLAEEEPEPDPYAEGDSAFPAGETPYGDPQDAPLAADYPEPRSGRLVAEDEGAHPRADPDLVARDVGVDGGAAGAEEAAVHVADEADVDYP